MLREFRDRSESHDYQENSLDIVKEASKAVVLEEDGTILRGTVPVVALASNIIDYDLLPTLYGVAYGMFQVS